uniref:TIR domain-containing protein n=1 Tax=Candidatus Kentrum sp. LFY TaxID=2126342 RepID=A0A450WU05_9GAMM|nr:MAG: TIR domain-containing protein [Candidatus Kentron sp. LFY]
MSKPTNTKRFAVAVSFPDEHRRFVRNVVERLAEELGRERIFYDEWYEAELAGADGDLKLRELYREHSELVAPFFSEHYKKPWCEIEWSAIRAMLQKRRAEDAVIPVRMDGTEIPGWEPIDFEIRRKKRSGKKIADIILEIYRNRHPDDAAFQAEAPPLSPRDPTPPATLFLHGIDQLKAYGDGFAGRTEDMAALDEAWGHGRRVFVLHAEGGAGKTRVLVKWLNDLRDHGWRGAGGVFVHSFYSQGSDERRSASSEVFFQQALDYFDVKGDEPTGDPAEKARRLAQAILAKRGLLILDGLEPLQHPPAFNQGRLEDPAIFHLLLAMANAAPAPGSARKPRALCVVTSRQPVVELQPHEGRVVVQRELAPLSPDAGCALLRELSVRGTDSELRDAVTQFHGHAYSLMLLGSYLRDATEDRHIRRYQEIPLLSEDREHGSHAGRLFRAYVAHLGADGPEVAVLRLLGFFDRPAKRKLLRVLIRSLGDAGSQDSVVEDNHPFAALAGLDPDGLQRPLNRLQRLQLIIFGNGAVDAHPLLRQWFAHEVKSQFPDAWRRGHRGLFDHLTETTPQRPDTLEGLEPLYQAVAHGCEANLHQKACVDVYLKRILRGTGPDGFYSTKKLGAFGADLGAVTCFFTRPWREPSANLSPADQGWLLGEAATRLRALGRLREALEPMRAGLEMAIGQEDWPNAARSAGNLSELQLTLGELGGAMEDAKRAVELADRVKGWDIQMIMRTTHGDALHQAGKHQEARALFAAAEDIQRKRQPEYPRLYSLWGFRYCELLLSEAERAAWRCWLSLAPRLPPGRLDAGWAKACKRRAHGHDGHGARGTFAHPTARGEIEDARKPHHGALPPGAPPSRAASPTRQQCDALIAQCNAVMERAEEALSIAEQGGLSHLTIALDQLTLARAELYRNLLSAAPGHSGDRKGMPASGAGDSTDLEGSSGNAPAGGTTDGAADDAVGDTFGDTPVGNAQGSGVPGVDVAERLATAVAGLRKANTTHHLPRSLLTEAWHGALMGDLPWARSALAEAEDIAGNGPMPLFLADIFLTRARILGFGGAEDYGTTSARADVAEARALIERHGYRRRDGELRDVEAALHGAMRGDGSTD